MTEANSAALEYILNKYVPYTIISFLVFSNFGFANFAPWVIMGLVFFIDKYSFKLGRSIGEYENNPEFRKEVERKLDE